MIVYLAGKMRGSKQSFAKRYLPKSHFEVLSSDAMDLLQDKAWGHTPPKIYGLECLDISHSDENVQEYVIDLIEKSDMLVAYIETTDCYGTIAEIGYASALGKPCHIVFSKSLYTYAHSEPPEPEELRMAVTDAFWLVCSFPNVHVHFESNGIDSLDFYPRR